MRLRYLIPFLLSASLWATNYTVKSGGGGSFTTMAACASQMATNGTGVADTCTVFAGTYNETVTVPAGSAGNYKTFTVNGTDTVSVLGFTLNSHTKLIGNCPEKQGTVTTASCGFFISNPSSFNSASCVNIANSAIDVYVRDNVMYACGSAAQLAVAGGDSQTVTDVYVQGNSLSYACAPGPSAIVNTTGTFTTGSPNSMTVASVGGAQNGWVVYGTGLNVSSGVNISGITGTTLTLTAVSGGNAVLVNETNTPIQLSPAECNGIQLSGNHNLAENNDLSHYTLGIVFQQCVNCIFRNNSLHDVYQAEARSNSHTDAFYASTTTTTQYNVIEGNVQTNGVGPDAKGILNQGEFSPCSGTCAGVLIFRFNTVNHLGSGNTSSYGWNHFIVYNNTYYDVGYLCISSCGGDNMFTDTFSVNHWSDTNNIWYYPAAQPTGQTNPLASDSASAATGNWGYSLAYCNANGSTNCALYGHLYQTGTWTGDTGNILGYANQTPATNNPSFVNAAAGNFNLQAGSPAIAAGTYLTTANGSGTTSTSLVVTDASYFQDGYGLTNAYSTVSPDCISVTTVSNHVCITAVNYSTNTLTLASAISWTSGDHIWLYSKSDGVQVLTGSAPDMGAFPFTNPSPAPFGPFFTSNFQPLGEGQLSLK